MKKLLYTLALFSAFTALPSAAVTIGGTVVGWEIDFDKVTPEQRKRFGWFDDELKVKGFKKFSQTYSAPGQDDWRLAGKVMARHDVKGPAFFSIVELLNDSTIEDVKKVHYRAMSESKGFKESSCVTTDEGAQSCEVHLSNWSPAKAFYAVFYEWKTGSRTFVLVVRNAQPVPDRATPEAAARVLIRLIQAVAFP